MIKHEQNEKRDVGAIESCNSKKGKFCEPNSTKATYILGVFFLSEHRILNVSRISEIFPMFSLNKYALATLCFVCCYGNLYYKILSLLQTSFYIILK